MSATENHASAFVSRKFVGESRGVRTNRPPVASLRSSSIAKWRQA